MIDRRATDSVLDQRIASGERRLAQLRTELKDAKAVQAEAVKRVNEQTANVLAMIEGRRYV